MNQSCLSFGFIKGTLSIFNPWRGGWPSRMLEGLSYHNQYRKGRGRGNPRGSAPLCRGARDLLVPGVSFAAFMLLLSSTRESRPGRRSWQSHDLAERPLMGAGAKSDDLLRGQEVPTSGSAVGTQPPRKEAGCPADPGKAPNNSKRKNRIPAPLLV